MLPEPASGPLRLCPNDPPCPHGGALHDIYEPGDPWPTCCAEGCRCGHPGTATVVRDDNGAVFVLDADPVIAVDREMFDLDSAMPWTYDGEVLQLDPAGEYRYRYLRPSPTNPQVLIFGRERDTGRGSN